MSKDLTYILPEALREVEEWYYNNLRAPNNSNRIFIARNYSGLTEHQQQVYGIMLGYPKLNSSLRFQMRVYFKTISNNQLN